MPRDDSPKMPYQCNHSQTSWSGTAQRNYKDPKRHTPAPVTARSEFSENELPENLLTGRNPIREALRAGRPFEKLLFQRGDLSSAAREIISLARDQGVVTQEVDKRRLDEITPNHQGLIAYVSQAEYSEVSDIFQLAEEKGEAPFIVILDGITDPHNLGAIIRSAHCAGAHGVIIPKRGSAGLNPACVKAAAGATEYVKTARVTNLSQTIEEIKQKNVWVYAADMGGQSIYEADLSGPLALVIGSEGEGVSRLVRETCDGALSIPMKGRIDSLNASVAAGIMLFEAARHR